MKRERGQPTRDIGLSVRSGYLAASAPSQSIEQLSQAAVASRALLLSDASALATRGFIDGQRLKDLRGPNSQRSLAFDLFTLAALLRDN